MTEAEKSIYLKQQVANMPSPTYRFFELIQSQTETVMLAECAPSTSKTIDPAVVPEEKVCIDLRAGHTLGLDAGCRHCPDRRYARSDSEA